MDEFAAEPPAGVVLTGYVSDGELEWLYRNCFGFVYPSLFEGFGMPVLEALSLGASGDLLEHHLAAGSGGRRGLAGGPGG